MKTQAIAEKHSANCFLNSLFREWSDYFYDTESSSFIIHLKNRDTLIIPLQYHSLIGRHEYTDIFFIKDLKTDSLREISFLEMVHILLGHLSEKYQTTPAQLNTFVERIENSVANISEALNIRSDELEKLYSELDFDFKQAEQSLIIGHTFHPHPKSRDEFSSEDYKTYAPETGGEFFMHWFLVRPEVLHQHVSKNFEDKKWTETIFINEFGAKSDVIQFLNQGYIPFPVHPWQREVILKNSDVKTYIEENLIIDLGKSFFEEKWTPTSSLRSIYRKTSPYMMKFSLSVRLTNSIRHLLPLEVVRGLQVMDVFSTQTGKEFLANFPDFNVVFEPAFISLVDKNKNIINETIVAMRLNPFIGESKSQQIVLATLTQDHPIVGMSLIGSMIKNLSGTSGESTERTGEIWFQRFLDTGIKPFLMAQANYGIYLGAHQQNLIIDIEQNMPVAAFFRDCQGTGYSQTGFEIFAKDVDLMTKDNGNVLDAKMGNYLFSYYLIINSTFNVIAAIAKDAGLSEKVLMNILRENLLDWKKTGVRDTSCFDYLLNEKHLMQKGNFLCSFVNMNENTTENPLSIYNPIPNPIYEKELC